MGAWRGEYSVVQEKVSKRQFGRMQEHSEKQKHFTEWDTFGKSFSLFLFFVIYACLPCQPWYAKACSKRTASVWHSSYWEMGSKSPHLESGWADATKTLLQPRECSGSRGLQLLRLALNRPRIFHLILWGKPSVTLAVWLPWDTPAGEATCKCSGQQPQVVVGLDR